MVKPLNKEIQISVRIRTVLLDHSRDCFLSDSLQYQRFHTDPSYFTSVIVMKLILLVQLDGEVQLQLVVGPLHPVVPVIYNKYRRGLLRKTHVK